LAGKAAETISLFIGPEGGFAEDEIALAQANGIVPVTLGKRILRAETAAIVASSFIMYDYEQ
jgi:16S rRNA (uracil1498-N3)-methyltransferase